MDLEGLVSRFPGVRVATEEDNGRILKFYERSAITGRTIRLRSVRGPDFFKLLHFQGERATVLLYENAEGELAGVATLVHRKGYLNGVSRPVHYLGDFRMAFDRRIARIWREFYTELLREHPGEPTITAVIDENERAQSAFVRQGKAGFRYEVLQPYRMVNVMGRAPIAIGRRPRSEARYSYRQAMAEDLLRLQDFLDRQARRKAFGYCFGEGELARRLEAWDGLKLANFLLAEGPDGRLAGCFAGWSPEAAKSNVIEKIPGYFNFYRPWITVPKTGEALRAAYLTHLELDLDLPAQERRAVFRGLFDFYFDGFWAPRRKPRWHMASFADFPTLGLASALKGRYLLQEIPMKLFTVRHEHAPELRLEASSSLEPGFEIALV